MGEAQPGLVTAAMVDAGARALADAELDIADKPIRLYAVSRRRTLALAVLEAAVPLAWDRLIAALKAPAVTGTLAMLEEQGGGPEDLAHAILEALAEEERDGG